MVSSPDGPSDSFDDLDAQWADLTARLGPLDTGPLEDFPEAVAGSGDAGHPSDDADASGAGGIGTSPGGAGADDAAGPATPARGGQRDYGPRDYEVEEAEDEGFVPPDPGPVITGSSRNTLPWFGAVGGPIAVLVMLVLWPGAPPAAYLAALTATIAGLLVLWWRLPVHRSGSDDDGAVV